MMANRRKRTLHFTFCIVLVLFITMFSCKKEADKNKGSKTTTSNTKIEKKSKTDFKISEKYSNLFHVELVGLTEDPKNNKRYYVDFSSACLCNSPSILLKEKKAFLFGYCKDSIPPLSKDPFYTYDIVKVNETHNSLSVFLRNDKNEKLHLIFNNSVHEFIYELKVIGEFPSDYIGNKVSDLFTYKAENFEVEDCGDFDG